MTPDDVRALFDEAVAPLAPSGPPPATLVGAARTRARRRTALRGTAGAACLALVLGSGAVALTGADSDDRARVADEAAPPVADDGVPRGALFPLHEAGWVAGWEAGWEAGAGAPERPYAEAAATVQAFAREWLDVMDPMVSPAGGSAYELGVKGADGVRVVATLDVEEGGLDAGPGPWFVTGLRSAGVILHEPVGRPVVPAEAEARSLPVAGRAAAPAVTVDVALHRPGGAGGYGGQKLEVRGWSQPLAVGHDVAGRTTLVVVARDRDLVPTAVAAVPVVVERSTDPDGPPPPPDESLPPSGQPVVPTAAASSPAAPPRPEPAAPAPPLPEDGSVALLQDEEEARIVLLAPGDDGRADVLRTLVRGGEQRLGSPVVLGDRVWFTRTDEKACTFSIWSQGVLDDGLREEVRERPGVAGELSVSAAGLAYSYAQSSEAGGCGLGERLVLHLEGGEPEQVVTGDGDDTYADLALAADGRLAVVGGEPDRGLGLRVVERDGRLREVALGEACSASAAAWSGELLYTAVRCSVAGEERSRLLELDRDTYVGRGHRNLPTSPQVAGIGARGDALLLLSFGTGTRAAVAVLEPDGRLRDYYRGDGCPEQDSPEDFCRYRADW